MNIVVAAVIGCRGHDLGPAILLVPFLPPALPQQAVPPRPCPTTYNSPAPSLNPSHRRRPASIRTLHRLEMGPEGISPGQSYLGTSVRVGDVGWIAEGYQGRIVPMGHGDSTSIVLVDYGS
ncbi:hypothetical protein IW261DRAFT_1602982 [Armillaria novae-zelandiae]|uniref:Uncharacterized protein n=1 Tax=Armillaria novae-zelandiae TaxID=153914 RepID=A0AA39PRS4_9AGAR|nr:hypothetical protein IW261DRAFT_1602982 [Armillaria novae-zelandiae]